MILENLYYRRFASEVRSARAAMVPEKGHILYVGGDVERKFLLVLVVKVPKVKVWLWQVFFR